jgi:hypothetical protein
LTGTGTGQKNLPKGYPCRSLSIEFDTEGITEPAEVIVDLGIESDEGVDVDEDIDNGNGTVGFDQSHYAEMLTLHCTRILMQMRLNQEMDKQREKTCWSVFISQSLQAVYPSPTHCFPSLPKMNLTVKTALNVQRLPKICEFIPCCKCKCRYKCH